MKHVEHRIGLILRVLWDGWALVLWSSLIMGWEEAVLRPDTWYLGLIAFYVYTFVLSTLRRKGILEWKTHWVEKWISIGLIVVLLFRAVVQMK